MSVNHPLVTSISRLKQLPSDTIDKVTAEIIAANLPWEETYSDYQSNGWWTVSLFNKTGSMHENIIEDCEAVPSTLLESLPITKVFLSSFSFQFMWARIARMDPGARMWEHVDYIDLSDRRRLRLHIPLLTNPDCYMIFSGMRLHMDQGWLWKLDPRTSHAACNLGSTPRYHLILDCYVNNFLEGIINEEKLLPSVVTHLPPLSRRDLDLIITRCVGESSKSEQIDEEILSLFHHYNLELQTTYDLLIQVYSLSSNLEQQAKWRAKKDIHLGSQNF